MHIDMFQRDYSRMFFVVNMLLLYYRIVFHAHAYCEVYSLSKKSIKKTYC